MKIRFENISKRFGDKLALDKINLNIGTGVTAVAGDNGCGKTTLLKILLGLVTPDTGTLTFDVRASESPGSSEWIARNVGFCPAGDFLFDKLSGRGNLEHISTLRTGIKDDYLKLADLLTEFRLDDELDDPFEVYSSGMRKKLQLVSSLVGRPGIVVWDEPFASLDEKSYLVLKRIVRSRLFASRILVFTNRRVINIEDIADCAIVLDRGSVAGVYRLPAQNAELNRLFGE